MKHFFLVGLVLVLIFWCIHLEAETTVRILSYNIHHGEGQDKQLDLERIAQIIESSKADIICLQEVDKNLKRSQKLDIAQMLGKRLNMQVCFGVNYLFSGGEYGTAILSRWPILKFENHPLPTPEKEEPRGCLVAEIDVEGTTLQVLCTHWGLTPSQRQQQSAATLKLLGAGPLVLAGDFNEDTGAAGLQGLMEKLPHSYDENELPRSYPTPGAEKLIDYIL